MDSTGCWIQSVAESKDPTSRRSWCRPAALSLGPSSSNPVPQRTFASRTHALQGYSVCAPGFVVAMGVHCSHLSPRENSAASLLPARDRPGGMGHSGLPGGSSITSPSLWGSPSAGPRPLCAALQAEPLPSASPFPGVRPAPWVSPPSPSPPIHHRLPTQSGSYISDSNQASELAQSSTWLLAQDPAGGWVPTSRNGIRDTHGHNMTSVLCVHLSPQSPTPSSSRPSLSLLSTLALSSLPSFSPF